MSERGSTVDRPGPVHDNALRWLAVHDLVTLCRWIGVDADEGSVRISEALPATTQHADLVVGLSPGRLAHIEFVTTVGADLPLRMHEYRSRLMRREPGCRLEQHVLVLGRGQLRDEYGDAEHWFRLHVTYLRDRDPSELLGSPSLAPLAALARAGSHRQRTGILQDALQVIRSGERDEDRRAALIDTAESLAQIYLEAPIIDAAGKERVMPIDIDPEVWQRTVEKNAELERRKPELEALVPTVRAVRTVLQHRFGEDRLMTMLAWAMTDRDDGSALGDPDTAVSRALEAESLAGLMATYLGFDGS